MAADKVISIGAPAIGAAMHDLEDGSYSLVVHLDDASVSALASAIALAMAPE